MFEKPKDYQPFTVPKGELSKMLPRELTEEEKDELGLGEKNKRRRESKESVSPILRAKWQNPENQSEREIEIDIQKEIQAFEKIYKDNFQIEVDQDKILSIWNRNFESMKNEIETYGYDQILIIPDNSPEEPEINNKAVETMDEGAGKGKVAKTKYWIDQNSITPGEKQKYRIILVHSDQNIYQNEKANPYLKATLNKNISQLVLNISQIDWNNMEDKEKEKKKQEAFQKLEKGADINFETEFNGQKILINSEGLSLREYQIFQRAYFEKNQKHLDENGWTWLPKSFLLSRVVSARWSPAGRQLRVYANEPGGFISDLGLRLSRSFS